MARAPMRGTETDDEAGRVGVGGVGREAQTSLRLFAAIGSAIAISVGGFG